MTNTIVMIHGMFCSGWHWSNYDDFFKAKGYECIVPTLRYHDIDPKDLPNLRLGTTSLLDYAEDLEDIILSLDEKPILMGHSMGGLLAQILGSRGLAKALVLLTTAPPSGINALRRMNHVNSKRRLVMFGLGVPEIIVIGIIILLIFGAKRLPVIGESLGKTVKEISNAKKEFNDIKSTNAKMEVGESNESEGQPQESDMVDTVQKKVTKQFSDKVLGQVPGIKQAKKLKDKADKIKKIVG